ncbi:MAG TPA: TonB-dependent receptor [Roseiarcus sp.]|nr:TonB-dependent receptor [Roseiarcus sp.]
MTSSSSAEPIVLPEFTVVAPTPLPGSDVDRDKIPATTYVLDPRDISWSGVPALTDAITREIPSTRVEDVDGNPFQPNLIYRGFIASPVAGTPQGLAVYVNGARFNDPFGDTVNWDLIPAVAIQSVTVESSNPLFGLNALGGSVNVQLKNGFTFQGGDSSTYAGSYGRLGSSLEYGRQVDDFAIYGAGEYIHDNGFQPTGESQVERGFLDLGWREPASELHLDITGANNWLGNPGASPVQALQANLGNIFTAPNTVYNQYFGLNLHGTYAIDSKTSIQGVAYVQNLDQRIPNGTTVDVSPCNDGSGLLCNGDGSYVTGAGGAPIPDFANGGPYSGLSTQTLNARSYGASLQLTNTNDLAGRPNHLVVGASFDGSDSAFSGTTTIGGFDPISRFFIGPGFVQVQPDEGVNPVKVQDINQYYGIFGQDIFTLLPKLDLTLAGRYNYAQIDLSDQFGGPVNGNNTFAHFNPMVGLTYRVTPWLQLYGSYAVTNRAPTPQELSCSSAANPCSLLNFFVGDPPLQQVVADTFEFGARGTFGKSGDGLWSWNADIYHAAINNDLVYETMTYNPNLAYYVNAGKTLRQGLEFNLHYDTPALHAILGYAYTDATFQSPLLLGSDNNPMADANGDIQVVPGDRIPGIPLNRITGQVDYNVTDKWIVGASASYQSSFYRYGDEANLTPPVSGYFLANLHMSYQVTNQIKIFALVNNLFDTRYYTYGTFGPVSSVPWPSVPGGVTGTATAVPGRPFSAYAGMTITF